MDDIPWIGPGSGSLITTPHGPVRYSTDKGVAGPMRLFTSRGDREAAVLRAAADWLAEHRYAVVAAMNWMGDVNAEHSDDLLFEMRLVIDMTLYTVKGYRD